MGLFKQIMIFGKTGLQGLPTRVTIFLWAFSLSRQGATGVPLFTTWDSVASGSYALIILWDAEKGGLGESPNTWKHFGPEPTQG